MNIIMKNYYRTICAFLLAIHSVNSAFLVKYEPSEGQKCLKEKQAGDPYDMIRCLVNEANWCNNKFTTKYKLNAAHDLPLFLVAFKGGNGGDILDSAKYAHAQIAKENIDTIKLALSQGGGGNDVLRGGGGNDVLIGKRCDVSGMDGVVVIVTQKDLEGIVDKETLESKLASIVMSKINDAERALIQTSCRITNVDERVDTAEEEAACCVTNPAHIILHPIFIELIEKYCDI